MILWERSAKNFAETSSALRAKVCAKDCSAIHQLWIFLQSPLRNSLIDLNFYVPEELVIKLHKRWETKMGANNFIVPGKTVLECV